jgi:hypothetical protein
MHPADAITHVAHAEARRFRPICDPDEMVELAESGKALPYIQVSRGGDGRLQAEGIGYHGHENAGRMPFLCDFLMRRVLPMVDTEIDVRGMYRVELHDAYSYLLDRSSHQNALGFARPKGATESVALMPDPFQMGDFNGLLSVRDHVPWESKAPILFFAGTTTGDRNPTNNERIKACVWSLGHRDVAQFHITNIAQMDAAAALATVPALRSVLHKPVPVEEHHRYRYQVNIAGNTACWSRVPMIMSSSCLMLNMRQPDVMWYSPLLSEGVHYVGTSNLDDLLTKRTYCESNSAWCKHLSENARRFVTSFMGSAQAASYFLQLLEASATHSKP